VTGVAPELFARAPRVGGALIPLWLAACASPEADSAPSRCAALAAADGTHTLTLAAAEGTIDAQLAVPADAPEGAPVVLQTYGAWDPAVVPDGEHVAIDRAITLRVALSGAAWGDGTDDVRGPLARGAVAAALRYAAGETEDGEGCALVDRAPAADVDTRVAFAQSNGGNLVMATLADAALDAPAPVGLVLWETPAGAGFVNKEADNSPVLYAPGTCTFTPAGGVACPFPADHPPLAVDDGLCFDVDGDGACTDADLREKAPTDPATGRYAGSATLAAVIAAQGLPVQWDDAAASAAFWSPRDAALAAPAVVSRHPELDFLLLASETDHVLHGLADHPHVYGLGEALQAAGARWVRLNPGSRWSGLGEENTPNLPLSLAHPDAWLVAEADENPLDGLATAAVDELADRARSNDW
jgi:hypothetical protein